MEAMHSRPVLIASGDPYQIQVMESCLVEAGYQVQTCSSGPAVLQALTAGDFSLAIFNYDLPERDAIQLLSEIRSHSKSAHLPVILFGSGLGEDERMKGFEAGADMCLEDELMPRVVLARVKALLRRSRRQS
jgi:DNA-binding response OmpR family regulator